MLSRLLYTIRSFLCKRTQLKHFVCDHDLQIANITSLTPQFLSKHAVDALVLDFDGVLSAHHEEIPRPEVLIWLENFVKSFAPKQVFILSNQPTKERAEFFRINFPSINFVFATRKKPYPDGLLQIIKATGLPGDKIMLVDDRLGTGILATILAGSKGLWLTKPYINYKLHPVAEYGLRILRAIEYWGAK